ncbi:MAG: ankyrin repeat domain-containing protein [Roseibacillus sp.]
MHSSLSLLALLALVASLTAFLHGHGPQGELSARAALTKRAVPVESASLIDAVMRGDREIAVLLLRSAVDPNVRDSAGRTPLMRALHAGRPALAEDLIDAGANLSATDAKGDSVLGYAVRAGETSVVTRLVDRGVDPNTRNAEGGHVVADAMKSGRTASAKLLLDAGASKWSTDSEKTPLIFHATERGADWMVERLVASGVQTDARNAAGDSLIHALVRGRNDELLRLFWKHGLDLNAINGKGETAVHLAVLEGRAEMLPALLEHGASAGFRHPTGWEPLHLAPQRGDLKAVWTLLAHGANVNAKGAKGRTAMDLALAMGSSSEQLQALLEAGADPDSRGPDGRFAIDVLIAKREFTKAKLLLQHGAHSGPSLYNAVVEGDRETISFLLAHGFDPNEYSKDPVLVAAVREGHADLVAKLLGAGAAIDQRGREGQSALHLAVAMDRADLAKLLLEAGVDPNVPFADPVSSAFLEKVRDVGYLKWQFKRDSRITPIMAAADSGNLELARVLLAAGARKHVWTKRRAYYPIGFASRRDDVKMMQLLLDTDPDHEERWLKVDLSEQRAWVYASDGSTIFTTRVSTGKEGFRTKTGEFVITNKIRQHVSNVYKGAKMPYFQRLSCGDFGFHEGYCPSRPASHGCLRVPRGDASKLWKITKTGDRVVIVP